KTLAATSTSYAYDAAGNLLTVALPNANTVQYVVDGANRRIGKNLNGTLVQGLLYHDRFRPAAELDGAGHVVTQFVYASNRNVPAYAIKGANVFRIISDPLGSPRLVVNVATGNV